MTQHTTIFRFHSDVPMADVRTTLLLAQLAAASLHGDDRVRLQAEASIDVKQRLCRIDTSREVGQALSLIFAGYVRREFGEKAVRVERAAPRSLRASSGLVGTPEGVVG